MGNKKVFNLIIIRIKQVERPSERIREYWVLRPKASQVYSHRCCESVFDPDGVVDVGCLLSSINLVSLWDMKTIGKTLEPKNQVIDWVMLILLLLEKTKLGRLSVEI